MKFAHFSHVWAKAGLSPAQRYEQLWRELELCDQLGFDYGFCVEHHFRPDESLMSAPQLYTIAAGARTKQIRLGGMGHIVPLHHPLRLVEELAIADQMIGGRLEVGLVPGILPAYFAPFKVDYASRREVTLEFARFLKTAYAGGSTFDFDGKFHQHKGVKLAVNPIQKPHPPMWIETRDPATLEFCAREGVNTGYFLLFPREEAAGRYRKYLDLWTKAGWPQKPNIAYSTVVFVADTDEEAIKAAAVHAGRAYSGLFGSSENMAELRTVQLKFAEFFESRGEIGAAEIARNLLDEKYLLEHDLVLIGSPETVTRKLRHFAETGMFNTFMGEFNFADIGEAEMMKSIHLFGTKVMPRLRDFEPF